MDDLRLEISKLRQVLFIIPNTNTDAIAKTLTNANITIMNIIPSSISITGLVCCWPRGAPPRLWSCQLVLLSMPVNYHLTGCRSTFEIQGTLSMKREKKESKATFMQFVSLVDTRM